jgi:hypothetical protein
MSSAAANYMAREDVASSFDVKVLPSSAVYNRFWWLVRRGDGQIIASSPKTYSNKVEARNAAEVVTRLLLGHRGRLEAYNNVDEASARESRAVRQSG